MNYDTAYGLAMGDEDVFHKHLEEGGAKARYDAAIAHVPDPERFKRRFQLEALTSELTNQPSEAIRTGLPGSAVMKLIFKTNDRYSPEAFDKAARDWATGEIRIRDEKKSAADLAVSSFLAGESYENGLGKARATSNEAGAAFVNSFRHMKSEYGDILPIVRKLVADEKAKGERGLFQSADIENPLGPGTIARIYQRGGREKFLFLLGKVMEKEGAEIDRNAFTKFVKSMGRGAEAISANLGRKFMRLNAEANEEERSAEENEYWEAVQQVVVDTKDLRSAVSTITGSNQFTQGIYDSAQSVPYMMAMASPLGVVTTALSIQEDHFEQVKAADPNVSDEDAMAVATFSAPIEVGIEKLQFMTLKGKFPGLGGSLSKITGGKLTAKILGTVAAEYTQETIQEMVLPTIMDISKVLKEEMPGGDWEHFKVMDSRRFFAVLPLSILSGGGRYARDKFTAQEMREIMTDESQLRMGGYTVEEAADIAQTAEKNPDAALEKIRAIDAKRSPEEKAEIGDAAMEEIYDEKLGEGLEGMPLVRPTENGGMKVDFRDGRVEEVQSPAEAQELVDQWAQDEFVDNASAVSDFIGSISERAEGKNTVEKVEKITLQDVANSGKQTEESLKKAVAVYYAQMGEVAPDSIDLRNYTEQGSVQLRAKMSGFAVRIAQGANPLTVAEEFSEGFIRMIEGRGEIKFDEVKTLLDDFGEMSGLEMTEGYDVDPDRAVIEGFSKFAKAYMLQGKYDSLPESTQAWMTKAWRIMERPESMPKALRAVVEFFTKLLRSVYDVAKAIEGHKTVGNGIDPQLETLAQRALGFDEKGYNERMEAQYREELMEDVFDPAEELSQRIKGKLPRPTDPAGDGYTGELDAIFDEFRKETRRRGKNGKKVISTATAQRVFAPEGQGIALDELRESLGEDGFQYDTIGEMLDAIGESVRGEKQWPVGVTHGEQTFAITSAKNEATAEAAIDRLFTGPKGLVETGQKLRGKLGEIRKRFESSRLKGDFGSDSDLQRIETMNALMRLNAIASVLPREVRHVVGSPVPLIELKTDKARERNVVKRLEKIALALDKHMQKELRETIRKELDKSGFKVSDSRRRKGKIGKIGHETVDQIREVMTKTMEEAEAIKNSLTRTFEDIEAPQAEDFERWDSRTLATELFYDYENASTARLEQALDFVTTNYKEGRAEWLTKLKARKEERDQWVAEAISFMGNSDRVYIEDLTKAQNKADKLGNKIVEGVAEFLFSNHHTLARIVENAKDKDAAREWYNRLLDSRIQGDIKAERESDDKQQAFFDKVAEVIGAKGALQGHDVRKWLYEAKRSRANRVSTIEGESRHQVSVDKHLVESIINGEVGGIDGEMFSDQDIDSLKLQWEKFENLSEKDQQRVRKVKFERVVAQGERRPVGEISHAEALQWWLTMRQPDQREKLESMGWDDRTMSELEDFIPADVKAVGLWMSEDLVTDGKTLSDVHAEEFGIGLNTGENYFPVRNKIVDQPVEMDPNDPGSGRSISPGSLKERVVNRARPAQANAFSTYFQHVTEMAYWKHNVGWVRQYGGAMRTKAFAENMEAKVGTRAAQSLQKYLGAVQNRGVNAGRQMLAFEKLVKSFLSRTSLAVLGARISTMWINATAFMNAFASPDVSATQVMKNMIKMGLDSKGELKATWRNELAEMRRRYGASFEAQLAMKSGRAGHWIIQDAEKLAQKGLIPMNQIDVATNTLTMAAIYRAHFDSETKKGVDEETARATADEAVTRAQATLAQPTLAVSRSMAEMGTSQNPFMGIFTMFMSEARKNAANNYVAWRTLATGKGTVDRATAARQAAVYTLAYTGVVQAFRGIYNALTGDDDKDEEIEAQLKDPKFWTYAVASDNLRPIPMVGDAMLSLMAGPLDQDYWETKTPLNRVVTQVKQTGRIFDEKNSDSARIDEVIDQLQSWGSIVPGGPVMAQGANVAEFGKKVFEDGMGYSFTESDRVQKIRKEIKDNKEAIYEANEDKETRWELLEDVLRQYQEDDSELFKKVLKDLEEKKEVPGFVIQKLLGNT